MAEGAGKDPSQWFERAYSEDAMDETIAIGYARSLMQQQQVGAAIFVLDPLAAAGSASAEFRDLYAKALLSANRLTEAAPLVWQIFEQNPSRIEQVRDLIGAFLDSQLDREAVVLAEKLEHFQRRKGERRAFLAMMQDIVAGHRASVEMLEFLAEQFNSANREADYCATLLKLFELYCKEAKFEKAGEALDRAVEIDPYENGHQKRLLALKGKIDENRYQVISSRLGGTAPTTPVRNEVEEKAIGTSTLQDLMVQAEILVQYGMRNKALERLQRIQQLFPHEEDRNPELAQLYATAGLTPQYVGAPAPAGTPVSARTVAESMAPVSFESDMSGFTRVSEITKKLNRENSAEGVLNTMAVEIGTQWALDRCVAALRKPGSGVSAIKEFAAGGSPAKSDALDKLVCGIHDVVAAHGNLVCTDMTSSPELKGLAPLGAAIGVKSCVALPLGEGGELGLLLLLSSTPRSWAPNDVIIFKMIADQAGIALNNAGLRRLVKNLSVTDESSGLLKRASYLDLLLGEVRRAKQQNCPLSVMLMRFGERAALAKEQGEAAAESMMQRLGQVVAANVRQNDLAFRYSANAIAIVLGETGEKEALLVAEKMRRVMVSAVPEKQLASQFNAGIAEAVIRQEFEPVDIVTELINRVERSLEKSVAEGPGKSTAMQAAMTAAAVA
jgi:diguanylate cyclase (GGDEF)-like protein